MALSVSVALGTFNGVRYLEQQLRSIQEQSTPPMEIVLADDGSTDDTVVAAAAIMAGSSIPLVVLPPAPRLGVTRNFERAIRAARGELIALCDQDDVWHPDRLSADVPRFVDDPGLLLLHDDARLVDAEGRPFGDGLFDSLSVRRSELDELEAGRSFAVYLRRNLVTGAATLFRASLLETALPFPDEWVHDEWLGILAAARGGARLSRRQAIDYRQHGGNQIGVTRPTLRSRVGRMIERRDGRYQRLAGRSRVLVARLERDGAPGDVLALARRKAAFEARRAEYPDLRIARLGPVLRGWRRGDYRDLSSQRDTDVLRDLVQPA